jgi:serine/threonine protein kinase
MTNQASVSSGSVSDEESEDGYKVGGYHPMKISDEYNGKYTVVKKLGWGHFSTVWLVRNKRNEYSAMKVIKSAKHYTETAEDEIKFLRKIQAEGGHNRLLKIVDSFRIYGPNGARNF